METFICQVCGKTFKAFGYGDGVVAKEGYVDYNYRYWVTRVSNDTHTSYVAVGTDCLEAGKAIIEDNKICERIYTGEGYYR